MYSCRKCSAETNEADLCNAPSVVFKTDYRPYQKPVETPWGSLIPGTLEYAQAMLQWVRELQQEKSLSTIKAFVEAKKAGWHVDAYDMEDEVKEALEEAGLLSGAGVEKQSGGITVAVTPAEVLRDQAPSTQEPIPLEDIIKQMQEDSK